MTDREINLAIAKWCGTMREVIDNYCNDLNAMYKAEKHIARADWCKYAMEIRRIISRDCDTFEHYSLGSDLISDYWFYHCNAHQRAEAFLRVVGEWKGLDQ